MPRDAAQTRARILEAACNEFAAAGLAGARVDRIARAAESNVRMIYAYFGGKSALFDAAYRHVVEDMARTVPPKADALAEWAGQLFDYHQRTPRTLRISLWAQLERPEAAGEPLEEYADKVRAVAAVEASPLTGRDLLVFIYAIAQAWQLSPAGLTQTGETRPSDSTRTLHRREAVVIAASRLVTAR